MAFLSSEAERSGSLIAALCIDISPVIKKTGDCFHMSFKHSRMKSSPTDVVPQIKTRSLRDQKTNDRNVTEMSRHEELPIRCMALACSHLLPC